MSKMVALGIFSAIVAVGVDGAEDFSSSLRQNTRELRENDIIGNDIVQELVYSHLEDNGQNDLVEATFRIAHRESHGFFNDITTSTWDLMKHRVKEMPNHYDQYFPLQHADEPNKWYQMNWEPNFSCPNERRIGGMGDGPKWVCDPHRIASASNERINIMGDERHKCLVYSVGSNGNFVFEEALQQIVGFDTCDIHIFDPDDYSGDIPERNMYLHAWGIEANDIMPKKSNFKSLQETVSILGHEGRVLDIFKIDCEGCEWRTYQDWFNSGIMMHQILVETHYVPENANDFFETLQRKGYVTFHKEPNTWSAGGRCQEYAFLKLDHSFFEQR